MRLTSAMLDLELTLTVTALRTASGWRYWRDDALTRKPNRPDHIAVHEPTGQGLAIFTRPRRLAPSEMPTPITLPAGLTPVTWYPRLRSEIVSWLARPSGPPPGLITSTERNTP